MKENQEQSEYNEFIGKPHDWLPDGTGDEKHRLTKDTEWHDLENRLGQPRILKNIYFQEVFNWIREKFKNNPEDFSYFEAGCGHGNDLRAIKKELGGKGRFFGVDMSEAELEHGLEFYRNQESTKESRKLFAQGDLRNLRNINIWNDKKDGFSQPTEIKDSEFDLIYMEAVLHGLGHGKKTYHEKKEAAQQMFNELYRICKDGGKIFGRANVFDPTITKKQQLQLFRKLNNWRFTSEIEELEEMLTQAGFTIIEKTLTPHEKANINPDKKNILRMSFLAQK